MDISTQAGAQNALSTADTAIQRAIELARAHGAELTGFTAVDMRKLDIVGPVPIGDRGVVVARVNGLDLVDPAELEITDGLVTARGGGDRSRGPCFDCSTTGISNSGSTSRRF